MSATDSDEPIRITLRDVYTVVNATSSAVAALNQKFELQALASLQDTATVRDHEVRIRFLEKWAWSIPAAVVTAVASAVIAVIK